MRIFLKVCLIVLPICNSNIFSASESSTDPIEKSPSRWQKLKEAVQKRREKKQETPSTDPAHAQVGEVNDPFYMHGEDSTDPFALDEKNQHVRTPSGSDVGASGKTKK